MSGIPFTFDDGGRAEAGFKGWAGDCAVRALAIASDEDYQVVYDELYDANRAALPRGANTTASPRDGGTTRKVYDAWLAKRGWRWTPTMLIGSGCTTHGDYPLDTRCLRYSASPPYPAGSSSLDTASSWGVP